MLTTKHYTVSVFVPEIACPFQCVFCNQEKISGKINIPEPADIVKTIESHIATFKSRNRYVEVGFFGGSFTGIPLIEQQNYLEIVQPFIKSGNVDGIRLSTRPDYISQEVLEMLSYYNVKTIELGAQSFDPEVLKLTKRGHSVDDIIQASHLIKEYDFKLGLQMMIGLPGDTFEKSVNTAKQIIKLGSDNTRIYPAVVIRGTAMHHWYEQGRYKPLELHEAVKQTSEILPLFENAGVKVIRVGLHPSEGLITGKELVAGPFHISFKELVLTEIWNNILISATDGIKEKDLVIGVPPKEINYVNGYKSVNKNKLLQKFESVKIVADSELKDREFKIY